MNWETKNTIKILAFTQDRISTVKWQHSTWWSKKEIVSLYFLLVYEICEDVYISIHTHTCNIECLGLGFYPSQNHKNIYLLTGQYIVSSNLPHWLSNSSLCSVKDGIFDGRDHYCSYMNITSSFTTFSLMNHKFPVDGPHKSYTANTTE